jgi:hypothetical protein
MQWSARHEQGFALAAAAHADSSGALALPGLSTAIRQQLGAVTARVASMERSTRRGWLRELLTPPRIASAAATAWPSRALGLLAPSVERGVGRQWIARSPLPRAGFSSDRRLIGLLRKLAADPVAGGSVSESGGDPPR